jgi:hypothetical protein
MQMAQQKRYFKHRLKSIIDRWVAKEDDDPGTEIVDGKGHRAYVGGLWEAIGSMQFRFLVEQGLQPQHVFLDIACGSLRGGVRFIPYLERGNYLGIDTQRKLIDAGIKIELGENLYAIKKPEFVVSADFEFDKFTKKPDFALAQSLFTHLIERDIMLCLTRLRVSAKPNTRFYATFFECERPRKNPERSDPHLGFAYTQEQMAEFGEAAGWRSRYIGDWKHPRGQMMFEYSAS